MVLDVIRALGRRWYIVLVGLLLTAGLVFGAYKASPPEYNARALVLLLPPRADVGKGGNPFLLLSGLEQPAGILAAYFSSAPARSEVEAISPTAAYEVGIDDSTRGPVIAIDVTDESPADTLKVLGYLLDQIPSELTRLQQEVDTRGDAVVGSMSLTVDRETEPDISGTIRLMIAALVVGVVGTGFSAIALDGYLQRRRQLTGAAPSEAAESETDDLESEWPDSSAERIDSIASAGEGDVPAPEKRGSHPWEDGSENRPSDEDSDLLAKQPDAVAPKTAGAPAPETGRDSTQETTDAEPDEEGASSQESAWSW